MRALGLVIAISFLFLACAESQPTSEASAEKREAPLQQDKRENGFQPVDGNQDAPKNPFTTELKDAHRFADQAASKEDQKAAAVRLEKLFSRPTPSPSPHTLAVRQDLAARIAQLHLSSGQAEEARTFAQRGLALSEKPTVLRANLFIALGDAEEKLGNTDAAQDALLDALAINQQLFNTELETP